MGYFSDRTVINLDGVVNNRLTQQLIAENKSFALNDIWNQVARDRIELVTDYEDPFLQDARPEIAAALTPVYSFPSHAYPNLEIGIYKVVR